MVDQYNRMDGAYNHRSSQKVTVPREVKETTLVSESTFTATLSYRE